MLFSETESKSVILLFFTFTIYSLITVLSLWLFMQKSRGTLVFLFLFAHHTFSFLPITFFFSSKLTFSETLITFYPSLTVD